MNGPFYNVYLNCPLCGTLYSSISYPKYEDGMIICTCTAESVHNERSAREAVHNERAEKPPLGPWRILDDCLCLKCVFERSVQ